MAVEVRLRRGTAEDLPAIAALQMASQAAAQWPVRDYLDCDLLVAAVGETVVGFLVSRTILPETEILNLAVAPAFRRHGIGRALMNWLLKLHRMEDIFLEVRESNAAARAFYEGFSFQQVGRRLEYYSAPAEDAVVMKLRSC